MPTEWNFRKVFISSMLVIGVWTFVALVFSIKQYLWHMDFSPEKPFSFSNKFTVQFVSCLGWVALTPLIAFTAEKFLPLGKVFYRNIFYLALTGLLIILLQTVYQVITLPLFGYQSKMAYTTVFDTFKGMFISNSLLSFSLYAMTLGIILVNTYYKKFRERELRNSKLESNLTQAKLQALKMQLHPHFLFNTHNAISELVYTDPGTAERMIANLSDLLRISLDKADVEEVTLQQELSFVEKYIEIEQMRFQERLRFKLKIAPDTLDAAVPNMILQPLIENAVRHGITPLKEGGAIQVTSFSKNGKLHLRVMDDGVGLPSTGVKGIVRGIGLSNTQERLFYLYGDQQEFSVGSNNKKGFSVSIVIPFKREQVSEKAIEVLSPETAG